MRARLGWVRLSAPGDKCAAEWLHTSGWRVRHCGHPTANWPWWIEAPDGRAFASPNGRGFSRRLEAMRLAELGAPGCYTIHNNPKTGRLYSERPEAVERDQQRRER